MLTINSKIAEIFYGNTSKSEGKIHYSLPEIP